jgi:hypothetical protein
MSKATKTAKLCQSDYVRFVVDFAYLAEEEAMKLQLTTKCLVRRVMERRKK